MERVPNWPVDYPDQLIIGDVDCDVAVCCLWSNRQSAAEQLAGTSFAVIGNLYSRSGINSILRNIFANPRIRYIVITGKSLTDSCEALVNFFEFGVDDDGRIKNNGGRIDSAFPREALEELRQAVTVVDLSQAPSFSTAYRRFLDSRSVRGPFTAPRLFMSQPYTVETLPSEKNGFVLRGGTILEVWARILALVMRYGVLTPTDYGTPQRELLNVVSVVHNPSSTFTQLPSWADFSVGQSRDYVARFFDSAADPNTAYSYGNRLRAHFGVDQLATMRAELSRAAFSRRAVATLWNPVFDSTSKSPPCIALLQANIRDNELSLTCFVRSHDMFRAFPLNAAALAELQKRLCDGLTDIRLGRLVFVSQSAHIYSDCWNAACQAGRPSRRLFEQDPRGSFVFSADGELLIADHFDENGDLLERLTSPSVRELFNLLAPLVSRVDHALYLGKEIQRLEAARRRGEHYEQDRAD